MPTSIIRLYTVKVSVILGNLYSLISDLINRSSKLNSTYQKIILRWMAQTSLVGARILLYEKKNPDLLKLQVSVTLFSLESTNFLKEL